MPQKRHVPYSQPGAWLCLLLFGLLTLVAACGGSNTPTTNSGTTPTAIVNNPTSGTTNTPVTSSPTTSGTSPTATTSTGGTTPTATTIPASTPTPTPTQVFRPTPTPTPRPTPSPTPRPTPTPPPPPTVVVVISTTNKGVFFFSPKVINVTRGTIVLWRNETQVPHTVTGGSFGSGTINPGGTYSFQFTASGSYGYHCAFHPYMVGTVNVS